MDASRLLRRLRRALAVAVGQPDDALEHLAAALHRELFVDDIGRKAAQHMRADPIAPIVTDRLVADGLGLLVADDDAALLERAA